MAVTSDRPIEITARKVLSLEPTWRGFCGSSVIFRPFGIEIYERGAHSADVSGLSADLSVVNRWGEQFGFCPLPVETHHMTLVDLVHDGNVGKIRTPPAPADLDRALLTRTDPPYPGLLADLVRQSGIIRDGPGFTLHYDALEVRHSALVVALSPRDGSEAAERLERYVKGRRRLVSLLQTTFGIEMQAFRPHVTLGYFANLDLAGEASGHLWNLRAQLSDGFTDRLCTFTSARVHLFTDMVTFWPIELG